MSKILSATAVVLMMLSATSCYVRVNDKGISSLKDLVGDDTKVEVEASGVEVTKDYTFDEIKSIEFEIGKLEYIQADTETPTLTITADANYFDYMTVENENGDLKVKSKIKLLNSTNKITLTVTSKDIESITVKGAGEAHVAAIETSFEKFATNISGAGALIIDSFKGKDLGSSISGAGDIDLKSVDAADVKISISGMGDAKANFVKADNVKVSVSGAGDINLAGECDKVDVSVSGAADVDITNLKYNDSNIKKSGAVKVKK